ncbi:ABC-2 type transporter [Lachnospiraceae bacterium XBB2008]|nr:ABC-2 type transporter [Lachnospiraceae bacterium XBB2008]
MEIDTTKHTGRFPQMIIYLGKLFRMFIFQNDWKVLPMSAIIAGLVSFAVGADLFKTMEGTLMGTFALACVCIWNGFFNSIQVICRERAIIKREHRSGLHISSYIAAHVIYQSVLCMAQSAITLIVLYYTKVSLPTKPLITSIAVFDLWLTIFLVTFCADMMALMVSALARTTTTAMTVMPFLLIFQLVFSGGYFSLPAAAQPITNVTIAKWGLTSLCAQGDYNSLPMVSVWNTMFKMKDVEVEGQKPVLEMLKYAEQNNMKEDILMQTASYNKIENYNFDPSVVYRCWRWLLLWILVYIAVAVVSLEFIDKDRR